MLNQGNNNDQSIAEILRIISPDDLKKALDGYTPERADEFQEVSDKIANKLFEQEIKKLKNQEIVLMCGGSASGKTEFISEFIIENFQGIVLDSTLSTDQRAKIKIRSIQKSGNIPVVCLILPDKFSRAFAAFHKRERKIPEYRFYETHSGARKTALWIAKNYPEIELLIYLNHYIPQKDDLKFELLEFENIEEKIEYLQGIQYNEKEIYQLITKKL